MSSTSKIGRRIAKGSTLTAAGAMISATLAVTGARAQTADIKQTQPSEVGDIVVTASRTARSGFAAPTPTTVVGLEQIQAAAQPNIADYVNQLPALAGSITPSNYTVSASTPFGGLSSLSLRNLGPNRTLVLLDGRRVVGASTNLAPDVGQFPQGLINRVEVVTGGASAAWGSDAVAGVVNFVLDKNFVGFKGDVSGGITSYGDDRQAKIELNGGFRFAGGRGHVLISGEHAQNDGIGVLTNRPWYNGTKALAYPIASTPAGQPQITILPHVGFDNTAAGGIITPAASNGPLAGLIFGPGGSVTRYNYGLHVPPFSAASGWQLTDTQFGGDLDAWMRRDTLYLRASYDVSNNLNVWIEGSYGRTHSRNNCCVQYSRSFVVQSDNAFLPPSVADAMQANNLSAITVGNWLGDMGFVLADNRRTMKRVALGAEGNVDVFGTSWKWNAYMGRGRNKLASRLENISITANINRAVDAVRAADGAIVCRSTLTDSNDGCVPYDIFGIGVNSPQAIRYSAGNPGFDLELTQDVGELSFNGEPFSLWAGPISLAAGVDYRREAAVGRNEGPISSARGYWAGNFQNIQGSYHVWEAFAETVIPLAKDVFWAKSLEFNGAVRATNYSISGYVTTWKAGLNYDPFDGVRFRATRSRDIRAPNIQELFLAGQTNSNTVIDLFPPYGGQTFPIFRRTYGNVNLKPEFADTTGLGLVLSPRFLPGFQASVDYYNIKLKGGIEAPGNQQIMDFCFRGVTSFCQYIVRNAADQVTDILGLSVNFGQQTRKGIDIEARYRIGLDSIVSGWSGNLSLSALGTHAISSRSNSFGIVHESAGENSGTYGSADANWRWLLTAAYENEPLAMNLALRTVSGGVYNNDFIECTSNCPAPTVAHPTIDNNHIPGKNYVDLGFRYKFSQAGQDEAGIELYAKVNNVFNVDPPQIASVFGTPTDPTFNGALYDVLGRTFYIGVRFRM